MESRNMSEKEFEEFQRLLARELGAVDSEKDKEEEEITEMLRHESAAHDPALKAGRVQHSAEAKKAAAELAESLDNDNAAADTLSGVQNITNKAADDTETVQDNLKAEDIEKMLSHDTEPEQKQSSKAENNKNNDGSVVRGKYEKIPEPGDNSDEPKASKASELLRKTGKYEKVTEEQEGYFNPEKPKETAAQRRRRARKNSRILRTVVGISVVFVLGLTAGLIVNTIKMKKDAAENDKPVSAVQTDINGNVIETPEGECNIVEIKPLKKFTAVLEGETTPVQISMATTGAATADDILWESSDTAVAEITEDGIIKGVSAGECEISISAKADPSVKASISCTVRKMEKKDGVTYVDGILLINKSYGVDKDYGPGELTEETESAFAELCAAAAEEDLSIYLASGYRSYETQGEIHDDYAEMYGEELADTFSARPGFSEHQSGLAIDVNSIDDAFAETPEAEWLAKHCVEYGFIIRYAKDKVSITGYKYEPWHIRYVGKELAKEITDLGITLEEYLGVDSVYKEDNSKKATEAE